ncbi:putative sulfate exporter family transporter [Chryseotalea sanaruensis]|uniref:Putative sulfate exporter family transporter n=1 Tax=Chryseotalea sanaruensis TaxID=2482724 RepID=A0A401U5E7_9BACT|nr:putative sulfate exporter family transporter [Chryseotalea sanaruensis]GCC50095.1 putative sulfate exporter family transporter [Chryseotalea sanaruensis]
MGKYYLKISFFIILIILVISMASPIWGLATGLLFSFLLNSPFSRESLAKFHGPLLKIAVVGLGFGLNVNNVLATGQEGAVVTLMMLGVILIAGFLLAKVFKINTRTALLITSGTAICGGSAIAAMSPIVKAKNIELSTAMGVVFILNAIALLIFPMVAKWLDMSGSQFAWWAAMAIHDTSSVVGAASQFGDQSLALATTVKLTRVLWIIPVSSVAAIAMQSDKKKFTIPYFIGFFLLAVLLSSYIPFFQTTASIFTQVSKVLFTIVLFLIGLGLNKAMFTEMGVRPLLFGTVLWIVSAIGSLLLVYTCCSFNSF